MAQRTCSVEGCDRPRRARGWCTKHYSRWRRWGDPTVTMAPGFPENLLRKMEPQSNGCIYYTGAINADGYARVVVDGESTPAHRAAYEHFVGPIPEGMTLDHECHNLSGCNMVHDCLHRRCVNPEHLMAKPHRNNLLASPNTQASINAAKTHCKRGHEFTPENTYLNSRGGRVCRECQRHHAEAYRRRRRGG